jgi:hypothetical protein
MRIQESEILRTNADADADPKHCRRVRYATGTVH